MPRSHLFSRRARILLAAALTAAAAGTLLPTTPAEAATTPVHPAGIDVSRWQSPGPDGSCATPGVDWARVAAAGRRFVVIRATRSTSAGTAADTCFARNWSGARAHGIYRGAYHYAVPSLAVGSAVRDARAFIAVTGAMQSPGDLPPVLDLEATGGLAPTQLAAWTSSWLRTVRALTGRQPMIYTYPSFWRSAMADSHAFHAYPLWIANWTATPSVPGGWPTYAVHQYSASGRVDGISGDVDLDLFNGSAAQLHAFAHPATLPTAATSGRYAYRGSPWRLSGRLVTDRGAAVGNATVRLYRGATANGPWTLVSSTRTSLSGSYVFTRRPSSAEILRVRYAGGRDLAASWSVARSHGIRNRVATHVTSTLSATRVQPGAGLRVRGQLVRTTGTPLRATRVTIYQRVAGGRWTVLRTVRTSSTARYDVVVRPRRATTYRVAFAGSTANLPSHSADRTVSVR